MSTLLASAYIGLDIPFYFCRPTFWAIRYWTFWPRRITVKKVYVNFVFFTIVNQFVNKF